ncbi:MAG: DegT/DnrJ/EryC1/StrS family aminotransferase [Candidatus Dormibacteraeota bacterium]|nr:DegT/DnrJ/EryC1/StrS family aminotransferase [Candidatus Dormibacteraeota bacterium]
MTYIPVAAMQLGPDEEAAVLEVLRSGRLAQGPQVEAFEDGLASLTGSRFAVATSSGTAALFLTLKSLGIGPGDEVITTPMTFIATANSIAHTGATIVFADIDDSLNLSPAMVETLITGRTRAIVPVHLHGNPCDMSALRALGERHGIPVIQDACQAIGATIDGRSLGTFGTQVYSFYATKNLTCGEGGAVLTDDDEVARYCRSIRHQAYVPGKPYLHDAVGHNFRLTELQAAIGNVQLTKLDAITTARRENAAYFDRHIDDRSFVRPVVRPTDRHVYHQYIVRVTESSGLGRDDVRDALHEAGIGSAVHYPVAITQQPPYRSLEASCPLAEAAADDMISLPVHPGVTAADRERIVDALAGLAQAAA